ncbi:MAG: hypothetical protein C4293_17370, partial [Nitrospiraceae bacterium]
EADHRHVAEALQRTQELLRDPSVPAIYEGAFAFDRVLVRVDVLERVIGEPDGQATWRLIEVKCSTKVKEIHLDDLAVQTYVLSGAGVPLAELYVMHINTRYLYLGGELELQELFALEDMTAAVAKRQSDVMRRLTEMKATLEQPAPPVIEPDGHCATPYKCPFWNHCTKDKPARWVFHLPGEGDVYRQLTEQRIDTIDEISPSFPLSATQRRVKDNREWVSPRLQSALQAVQYPVHHLDFEMCMPAIPKFPMTRPYQPIPIQWSNHVDLGDHQVQHDEYLCMDPKDSREELAVRLLMSVGREGSICVYSGNERFILERLAEAVPSLKADLMRVVARLWDLFLVIRDCYYHPAFNGSFSIKSVLPAMVPSLSYDDLEIREGGVAAREYYRMVFEETDWVEKVRIREALLNYCARDTLAMLEVRRALEEKAAIKAYSLEDRKILDVDRTT